MNKEELKSKIIYQIRKGKNTFKELVKNLYGLYPTELEKLIHELLQESIIKVENNQFILISPRDQNLDLKEIKSGIIQKINTEFSNLFKNYPVPHPLDYDWRWSLYTLNKIFNEILNNHTVFKRKLLFLGAPTAGIFFALANREFEFEMDLRVVDKNKDIINFINKKLNGVLEGIHYDLQYELPQQIIEDKRDIIIIDSPWYVDYYKIFISRSTNLISENDGFVYTALFPLYTRPQAIYERMEILELFVKAGYSPISIVPSFLEYEIPYFEKRALEASGIELKENWRFGDLAIFKSTSFLRPLIIGDYIIDNEAWKEFTFKRKRISIRVNPLVKSYIKPEVIPIFGKSSTLPSVSRRHSYRKFVDLWTSDNEVFSLNGNNIVYDILCLMENDLDSVVREISNKYNVESNTVNGEISKVFNFLKGIVEGGRDK